MSCALKVKNLSVLVQQIGTNSYRVGALRVEYIEEWQKYRGGKRMLVFVQSWQVQPRPKYWGRGIIGAKTSHYLKMRFIESFGYNHPVLVKYWVQGYAGEERVVA